MPNNEDELSTIMTIRQSRLAINYGLDMILTHLKQHINLGDSHS